MSKRYLSLRTIVLLLIGFLSSVNVGAQEAAVLSLFVFKDGKPLEGVEFSVDSGAPFFSDGDGYATFNVDSGLHQLQIFVKDENQNLAFFKYPFSASDGFDTRVIVTLTSDFDLESVDVSEPDPATVAGNAPADESEDTATALSVEQSNGNTTQGFGSLSGKVISSQSAQGVQGARIYLQGSADDYITDAEGNFVIELPANVKSTISVVHADYSAITLDDLQVAPDETLTRTIELTPSGVELEEYIVLAPNLEGQIESVNEEKRDSSSVAEILGSEEFSQRGDSDAASALKRATGLTLIGGRFVYVRGLGDRYSTSQLNGLSLPSPDPQTRVVPLDMFPTGVVSSIKVQKGWSADLPANFGGGNINIRSRETPDAFFGNASVSLKVSDGTTFRELDTANFSEGEGFGFDSLRGLSDYTEQQVDVNQGFSPSDDIIAADLLKNPLGTTDVLALPSLKLSGSFGDEITRNPLNPERRTRLGWFGAYGYTQDKDSRKIETRRATFNFDGSFASASQFQNAEKNNTNYEHGGLLGLTYEKGVNHTFAFTNFYINLADKALGIENSRKDGDAVKYSSSWFERSLLISQLQGKSLFPDFAGLELDWSLQRGRASASEPLSSSYTFTSPDGSEIYRLLSSKINFQNNELKDELLEVNVDLTYRFRFLSEEFSSLSGGLSFVDKERDARSRRFSLFFEGNPAFTEDELDTAIETFMEEEVAKINLSSRPTESYTADHDIEAAYLKANLFPLDGLELELGLRVENSTQSVQSFQQNAETVDLISDEVLPQANMTYQLNEEMQVRLGFSQTLTRPDFREFANTRYQDPITADIVYGNEFLTYSELSHYDFRFEWYMSQTDHLTFGVFGKEIENPIETVVFYTDVNPQFTYLNAESAELTGVEFSWHRELGAISNSLRDWTISGNYSYTNSTINVFDSLDGKITPTLQTVIGELSSQERPMQGQSPHVLNLLIGYEARKLSASLVFNVIGERIVSLGTEGAPDLFEQPVNLLDIVSSYQYQNGLKLGLSLRNILDDSVEWKQGDVVVRKFRKGRSISFSANYKF